jgi:hypothetical protein
VSHAGANIEVHFGAVPVPVVGADRGGPCAAFLYSQAHGLKAAVTPALPGGNENAFEIRRDHAALTPQQARRMNAALAGKSAAR